MDSAFVKPNCPAKPKPIEPERPSPASAETQFKQAAAGVSVGNILRRLLDIFARNLPCRAIDSDGKPYLYRMYLYHFGGWRIYLHKFVGADGERWIHDHPFSGVSLILCGGYTEEVITALSLPEPVVVERKRRFFNVVSKKKFHRIKAIEVPTWTLFIHAPHCKAWGFLETLGDGNGQIYHNPFDQSDSGGAHWWLKAPIFAEVVSR